MTTTDKIFKVRDAASSKILSQQEELILKNHAAALNKVRLVIVRLYEKYPDIHIPKIQLAKARQEIDKIISEATDKDRRVVASGIKVTYKQNYYFTADAIRLTTAGLIALGPIGTGKVKDSLVNSRDSTGWRARSAIVAQDTANRIVEKIRIFSARKTPMPDTAQAAKELIEAGASKAINLLSTEMHRAGSEGVLEAIGRAEAKGVKFKRVWNSQLEPFSRNHQSMRGQVADKDGLFHYPSGNTSEGPGMSGDPADDCNCKCSLVFQKI